MNDVSSHNVIVPLEQDSAALASQTSPILLGLVVFLVILINHAVFIEAVTALHNRWTVPSYERRRWILSRGSLYFCIALLVVSHLVEISIWGFALVTVGVVPDFYKAAFFSGSTYTTLGYGEELLPGSWDAITVMIALSGMFSIAWTTSSLIAMIGIFHPSRLHRPKGGKEPKDM